MPLQWVGAGGVAGEGHLVREWEKENNSRGSCEDRGRNMGRKTEPNRERPPRTPGRHGRPVRVPLPYNGDVLPGVSPEYTLCV